MEKWKPINYEGAIYYDPRQELLARARRAERANDTYVAVPVMLAIACGNLRECGAKHTVTGDEDGPLPTPIEIQCRKPEGHDHRSHYNGYILWY